MTRSGRLLLVVVLGALVMAASCTSEPAPAPPASEFFLPGGDAAQGEIAFLRLRCFACHRVDARDDIPEPFSANRGPVLGPLQADQSRDKIADSIVSPSHEIPPPQEGPMSPMGSFREAMTVQQLIDLVAFVQAAGRAAE